MTRQFNQQAHCPNCRVRMSYETSFERWLRNHPQLDSNEGYCISDQDYWVQKFKTNKEGKGFQLLMLVEVKAMGKELSDPQRDLLLMVDQLTRNRRQTPTKELKYQAGTSISQIYSYMSNKTVTVRCFGIHLLTFSGLGPEDSKWIKWDKTLVDIDKLTSILKFDLDPDTLNPLDLRSHHKKYEKGEFLGLVNPVNGSLKQKEAA